jgi:hypothetical protein
LISDETKLQLGKLQSVAERPLVICDVDEVIVHFLSDFDSFTREKGFRLDRGSHSWGSNISHLATGDVATPETCTELVEEFFATRTKSMQAIDGAVASLLALAEVADVIMLTNLPHWAGDDRRINLAGHGVPFPVVTNSGPKGPAIQHLAGQRDAPVVFVDDSPHFVMSARDHAPDVHIVHFLQDEAAAANAPVYDFVSLRTHSWDIALPHILNILSR